MRWIVAALALSACGEGERSLCDRFLDRYAELAGSALVASDRTLMCRDTPREQLECVVAAKTIDDLTLCMQFVDPARRERARPLAAAVHHDWPGTAPLPHVLGGAAGCAFFGLVGADAAPLDDTHVGVAFAIRETDGPGDPASALVTMERVGDAWVCAEGDPAYPCDAIASRCRAR